VSLLVLGLLFISALFHAAWNLLLKQAGEKYLATWWALLLSSLCALPILAFRPISVRLAGPFILLSAMLEATYFSFLSSAYQRGDFSMIYPIARGAAPAFLAGWSALLLGERLSVLGGLGIMMIISGVVIVSSRSVGIYRNARLHHSIGLFALLIAVIISLYSIVDGTAVKQHDPAAYIALVFTTTTIFLTPLIIHRYGLSALLTKGRPHWRRLLVIGVFNVCGYVCVLVAYSLAQVSYAGAIREISVVIGALAGWRILEEPFGKVRVIGAVIVFVGVVLIAFKGT
jgi:drug/metabolite transporter (DMT)-like permease